MHGRDVLRAALRANATFSLICTVLLVPGARWLAPIVGLASAGPLVALGLGLLPFAAWLLWLARGPGLDAPSGRLVSTMDAGWVVGTLVLLVGWPDILNATGRSVAIAIAVVVATFAVWQMAGVRRLARTA